MKKTVAVLLLALLTFSLLLTGACGKSEITPDVTGDTAASDADTSVDIVTTANKGGDVIRQIYPEGSVLPELAMAADKSAVSAGDEVTITWNVSNAENLACFQFSIYYDDKVFSLCGTDEDNVPDLIGYSNAKEGQLIYTGVCTTTVDIIDETPVFSMTLQVNDGAEAGDHTVSCMVSQFMIGTDDDGEQIADLVEMKNLDSSVVITLE